MFLLEALLSAHSAISAMLDLYVNLASGTPWETVARDVSSTLGIDSRFVRVETSKDLDHLVDVISSWMSL